jgi:hypothetical protein
MKFSHCAIVGLGFGLVVSACAGGVDGFPALGDDGGPNAADGAVEAGVDARSDAPAANEAGSSQPEAGDDAAPAEAASEAATEAGGTPHTVFVSSQVYDGSLGGLSGADSKCQALATAAGLKGSYKAWLSDSTTAAAYRLTHATGPYVLVDGTVLAQGWAQLVFGGLLHAIDKTESGGAAPVGTFQCGSSGSPNVWTNTDPAGNPLSTDLDCGDWTSNTVATAFIGEASAKDAPWWTQYCQSGNGGAAATCGETAALYCFQQ